MSATANLETSMILAIGGWLRYASSDPGDQCYWPSLFFSSRCTQKDICKHFIYFSFVDELGAILTKIRLK